jgi:transcriptional regulator with XRE-family HTH domain
MLDKLELGRRLANHRRRLNLTQEALADRLGITPSGLARIETGRTDIPFSRLQQIAEALGVEVKEILFGRYSKGGVYTGPDFLDSPDFAPYTRVIDFEPEFVALQQRFDSLKRDARKAEELAFAIRTLRWVFEQVGTTPAELHQALRLRRTPPGPSSPRPRLTPTQGRLVESLAYEVTDLILALEAAEREGK